MISWIVTNWFWIALWWAVWFYIFISWYDKQLLDGKKEKTTPEEAFFMFILSGFSPFLAIAIIIGKALGRNNDRDSDK